MACAGARHAREGAQTPGLGEIRGDSILHPMYSRMDVIATFEPGGELRVRTATTQIDNQIAGDGHGAGLVRRLMNQVQHEVDAGSNAGARVALTVLHVQPIFKNSGPRGDGTKLVVTQVVGGAGVSVQKTGAGSDQCAR